MVILIGIDEAGYGPLLGPLVVSCTAFAIPSYSPGVDMWQQLGSVVSNQKKSLRGRLLITDSKKAFNRSSGLGHLERTSLAVIQSLGMQPENLQQLLSFICPETLGRLSRCEWYKSLENCVFESDNADISIAAKAFKKGCEEKGISLVGIKSKVFDVGYYNEMVEKVQNKSSVLFTAVCKHIDWAFKNFSGNKLQIIVDRQGGRSHYLPVLTRMFPDAQGRIIRETQECCSYSLTEKDREMRIHFAVKADEKSLPVSLASMISKYIRELMVGRINAYFTALNENIKPTAGYWQDGTRFVSDIETYLPSIEIDKNLLVRIR